MQDQLKQFEAQFGTDIVSEAPQTYLEEPRGRYYSKPRVLLRPKTVDDVSSIIRFCNERKIGVIPYAGGTGLVGGQVSDQDSLVLLSVERMTALRGIYPDEMVIEVEAGMILADVQQYARDADRLFPLSLAAEGSARIGGNLATNAGGLNVLRYGNARDLCLGLEAVLPNGDIHHGLKRLRKDNTGFDLKNLLIGSEGTLGVITAASLKLFASPKHAVTAMLGVESPKSAISLLSHLRENFGDIVTGFELISAQGPAFLAEVMPQVACPLSPVPDWIVLTELSSGYDQDLGDTLETSLAGLMETGLITDAAIAQNEAQRTAFWEMRESIPEANRLIGSVSSHDISLPISSIPDFIAEMTPKLEALDLRVNCFGHLGDGNLHYNVFPAIGRQKSEYQSMRDQIKEMVHDAVHARDGSVSAEHGIGRLKTGDLRKYGDPTKLAAISAIKNSLDPNGIMNPGVIIENAPSE